MTTFVENLLENEFPVNGFKPFIKPQELLRDKKILTTPSSTFTPNYRGFYSKNWRHGNNLQAIGREFAVELGDRLNFGNFSLKNSFIAQHGPQFSYRAALGLDLKDFGEFELTQQARNAKTVDYYQLTHYTSKNGMNTRANLIFREPHFQPLLTLSSLYNQTIEIFDRKTMKLSKKTSIYGIDTSFGFSPLRQLHYSLYYQSKQGNYDFIAAYMRKNVSDKVFSNQVVAGIKYKTLDQNKLLAKFSYNIEEKLPQVDLMVRRNHDNTKTLKTFHKISSNLKVGSGFTLRIKNVKLNGLAEVNLLNNDLNAQPFNLSFRIQTSDDKQYAN